MTAKNPVNINFNRVFLCLCISFFIPSIHAATPLLTHDLNPITLVYGLPLASPARLSKRSAITFSYNVSNTINAQKEGNETLFIDGETTELNLVYLQPLSEKSQLRIRLPFIKHSAGTLDGFIDDFHQFFGFPEGSRPDYPTDQLLFQYQVDGSNIIYFDEPTASEAGDLSIDYAFQLYSSTTEAGSIWTSLKLPSGDETKLNGSGRTDVALWYAAEKRFVPEWTHYYNIGMLLTGQADIIPDRQNREVYFGTAGLEWHIAPVVFLNVQLDFHTAFYQTKTRLLDNSMQISMGGHIQLSEHDNLNIVVVEDIYPDSAPDVTFQLGFSHLF